MKRKDLMWLFIYIWPIYFIQAMEMPEQEETIHLPADLPLEIRNPILKSLIAQHMSLLMKNKIKDQKAYTKVIQLISTRDGNNDFILIFSDRLNLLTRLARIFYDNVEEDLFISKVDFIYLLQDRISKMKDIEKLIDKIPYLTFEQLITVDDIVNREHMYPSSPQFIVNLSKKKIRSLSGLPELLKDVSIDTNIPMIKIYLFGNNIKRVPDHIIRKIKELEIGDIGGTIYIDSLSPVELQKLQKALPYLTITNEIPGGLGEVLFL